MIRSAISSPSPTGSGVCNSIEECCREKGTALKLGLIDTEKCLEGLQRLSLLKTLDLSGTDLRNVSFCQHLPLGLEQLKVTGCNLNELPSALTKLQSLKKLYAGGNRITDTSIIVNLPKLQHAGFGYNEISALPAPEAVAKCTELLSLDLSFNRFQSLSRDILPAVKAIPMLKMLRLSGNPCCLVPGYSIEARHMLEDQLTYLDDQRLESVFVKLGSRSTSNSLDTNSKSSPFRERFSAQPPIKMDLTIPMNVLQPAIDHPDDDYIMVHVKMGTLEIIEDPYSSLPNAGNADQAGVAAPTQPTVQPVQSTQKAAADAGATVAPPPQEQNMFYYHYEMQACDGSDMTSHLRLNTSIRGTITSQIAKQFRQAMQPAGSDDVDLLSNSTCYADVVQTPPPPPSPKPGTPSKGGTQAPVTPPPIIHIPAIPAFQFTQIQDLAQQFESGSWATQMSSTPFMLPAPGSMTLAQEAPPATPGKAGKGGKPGHKPATPDPSVAAVKPPEKGVLNTLLCVPVNVSSTEWLKAGIRLRIYRTHVKRTPILPVPTEVAPPATPPAGGKKAAASKAGKAAVVDELPVEYNQSVVSELIGEAVLPTMDLTTGYCSVLMDMNVPFKPEPALWDSNGVRMGLEDPRHPRRIVAHLTASLSVLGTANQFLQQ